MAMVRGAQSFRLKTLVEKRLTALRRDALFMVAVYFFAGILLLIAPKIDVDQCWGDFLGLY